MKDGIDSRQFRAELRSLGVVERRKRRSELREWVRASERATRGMYLVFATIAAALLVLLVQVHESLVNYPRITWPMRLLLTGGIVMLALGQWLQWRFMRRVRDWRGRHPFEEWRRSRQP